MNYFLEAAQAGLSPIPVDTATKRAAVRWSIYQEHIADHDDLIEWFQHNYGMAIVCGAISGRLICIDIEGSFASRLPELANRLHGAGIYEVFWSWVNGYSERTPRGGLHILVRIGGDGPVDHNDKLAMGPDGVWIETRGEGGYAIVAPSRNGSAGWELLSGGFSSIAYCTEEEWTQVAAVLASFDVVTAGNLAPPPPQPRQPTRLTLVEGDGWVDDALSSLGTVEEWLVDHGWQPARSADQYGQHWVRPGKDPREGHSASLSHEAGRLYVHSSNAGLPVGVSLDRCDLELAATLGRRPTRDERTEFLRQRRPGVSPGDAAGQAAEPAPASTSLNLPDDFWQSRQWLVRLRQSARERYLSADAVFGAVLSTYAAMTPMNIWLPPVVAAHAPLNLYCALVGRSGTGKTAAMHLAQELIGPNPNPDILLARSLRSGEGLINLATKPRPKGSDGTEPPSYRNAVQIVFDEGSALSKQAERAGATVIPYLNTAWAGYGSVGGAKAGESGYFPADLVRICAILGVQFGAAANLFTGESANLGFPQRLLFFGLRDPEMMNIELSRPGTFEITSLDLPYRHPGDYARRPVEIGVPKDAIREVRLWTLEKDHGAGPSDPLDGHRMNLRLRVAALLALIDGREGISEEDWALSLQVDTVSRSIRTTLLYEIDSLARDRAQMLGKQDAWRELARSDVWLGPKAERLAKHVAGFPEGASRKELKARLNASERKRLDEILAIGLERGLLIHRDGRFFAGGDK